MRATREATETERAHQRVWTPRDLGYNSVTWAKGAAPGVGGTLSLDVAVWGHREFTVHAYSDGDWALDMATYLEDDSGTFPFSQIQTFVAGTWAAAFVQVPVWAMRIRFLGRGLGGVAAPNSIARVHARS